MRKLSAWALVVLVWTFVFLAKAPDALSENPETPVPSVVDINMQQDEDLAAKPEAAEKILENIGGPANRDSETANLNSDNSPSDAALSPAAEPTPTAETTPEAQPAPAAKPAPDTKPAPPTASAPAARPAAKPASAAKPAAKPAPKPKNQAQTPQGKSLTVTAYAYCINGRTASGAYTKKGCIAVDPRVIPMGSKIYIPGYGWGKAMDTGGSVKGNVIDVWFPTNSECMQWGVRTVKITVQ